MKPSTTYSLVKELAASINSKALEKTLEVMGDKPRNASFYEFILENMILDPCYVKNPKLVKICGRVGRINEWDVEVIFCFKQTTYIHM